MRLYYAPNTIAVAAAIALEEAGLPYEAVPVDFAQGEQTKPNYHAINLKGRVPALWLDRKTILTETGAILEYISGRAFHRGLVPTDLLQSARMRSVMYYLASTAHVNHAHKSRGYRWADNPESWADMRAKVPLTMTDCADFIERECIAGPYILGDTFCIADAYLFVVATWLEGDGVKVEEFKRISTFIEAMEGRASVIALRVKGLIT